MDRADPNAKHLPTGIRPETFLMVRGFKVLATSPSGPGPRRFVQHVSIDDAENLFGAAASGLGRHPSREASDFVPIGEIVADDDRQGWSWELAAEDRKVGSFFDEAARRFVYMLGAFGRWPSFGAMLSVRFSYDQMFQSPWTMPPVDWFWATGSDPDGERVHAVRLYDDVGLVVDPDDGFIRLYSSILNARVMLPPDGLPGHELRPKQLQCLGCLLTGASEELGPEVVRGAVLDDQWRIEFSTCERQGTHKPSHFTITEKSGTRFHLVGCAESGHPVWAEQRWAGISFKPDCTPSPWGAQ